MMTTAAGVSWTDVHICLGRREVVRGVTLSAEPGRVTALVGPNGSGKTTLLRSLFGAVALRTGTVRVGERELAALSRRAAARLVAAVVQDPAAEDGLLVRETVALGRLPHLGDLRRSGAADRAAVQVAMEMVDVIHLAERDMHRLSGGERQRVHVARALAQEAPVLVLDEPTNHLDIGHQFALLQLLRRLASERAVTVVVALHDLSHAARWADQVAVLHDGLLAAAGAPSEVLAAPLTRRVFGVEARWLPEPVGSAGGQRLVTDPLG